MGGTPLVKYSAGEYVELAQVKGLGAVQHSYNWVGASPEQVLNNLSHKPCALCGACLCFKTKLQAITPKQMSPSQQDDLLKNFQNKGRSSNGPVGCSI